jgi:hypothetical protein
MKEARLIGSREKERERERERESEQLAAGKERLCRVEV